MKKVIINGETVVPLKDDGTKVKTKADTLAAVTKRELAAALDRIHQPLMREAQRK